MKYFPEKWVKLYFWIIKKRQNGAELKKQQKKKGDHKLHFFEKIIITIYNYNVLNKMSGHISGSLSLVNLLVSTGSQLVEKSDHIILKPWCC